MTTRSTGKPRIGIIDIETSPITAHVWGLWDQNVGLDFIEKDWSILSFAFKMLGSKTIVYSDTGGRGAAKVRDDKILTAQIRDVLSDVDIVVAQNGKKFDFRKINARLIAHGHRPPAPYQVIDTMIEARKYFAFTSQKLAYTSKLLTDEPKDEHKKFPGIELWLECLKDNPEAWKVMRKYNIRDIRSTEKVYLKLRPWINNHPNLGMYDNEDRPNCPKCQSTNLTLSGVRITMQGKYNRYQCQDCGGWARGKQMIVAPNVRKAKLVGV
jgi:hypothetical protein